MKGDRGISFLEQDLVLRAVFTKAKLPASKLSMPALGNRRSAGVFLCACVCDRQAGHIDRVGERGCGSECPVRSPWLDRPRQQLH